MTLSLDSQETAWQFEPTYVLKELRLFNWGGFEGMNSAEIDSVGTAVIGPTGSGKTTLVDALMTLLCEYPKYNLASTGGNDSDRDLASYVRGVMGAGGGSDDQSRIVRPGKTIAGLSATMENGETTVTLGCLLWMDGTSSSSADMKKVWIFARGADQRLEGWLASHQEGGMRALKQLEKEVEGLSVDTAKKSYLAKVRNYFDVRENAFNLLNRAAGLKQLNDINEIFRQSVLDNVAQFDRATEVANSFDDLTEIHEELETARRQLKSLLPVKATWEKFQENETALENAELLGRVLPVWFGEQAYRLWGDEVLLRSEKLNEAEAAKCEAEDRCAAQERIRDTLKDLFMQQGGGDITSLSELIDELQEKLETVQIHARNYQSLMGSLSLTDAIDRQNFERNKQTAKTLLEENLNTIDTIEQESYEIGSKHFEAKESLQALEKELREAQKRTDSNIPQAYHKFRTLMASELGLDEETLPFVGELIQVKDIEHEWHGAIERAIGVHRIRLVVSPNDAEAIIDWVNNRHNRLNVMLLEAKTPGKPANFFNDGFTRKLDYKKHPHREALKAFLSKIDRHCVSSPEELRKTPYAMTKEGQMSGRPGNFDKNDVLHLNEGWMTGFDNRSQVSELSRKIAEARELETELSERLQSKKTEINNLKLKTQALEHIGELEFSKIDIDSAEKLWQAKRDQMDALLAPNSDLAVAEKKYKEGEEMLKSLRTIEKTAIAGLAAATSKLEEAKNAKTAAYKRAETGMLDSEREAAAKRFSALKAGQINLISEIQDAEQKKINRELENFLSDKNKLSKDLVRQMSEAKKQDHGVLSETGSDIEDAPQYLARLKILEEEALPEKRKRFMEYLNRSSDDGVTQLLETITGEVDRILEKLDDVNSTLRRVDFQPGRYLRLDPIKVMHESLRTFNKAHTTLAAARFKADEGESQYRALQGIVAQLRDACQRKTTGGAKALLDPRFRLEFKVSMIDRESGSVISSRSGSQGDSGGEKESIASFVLTASLSYALCPDGSSRPLFGTIVLDEAFSRSSNAVASRIIAALKEFGLHALFITPNKEMRLLRKHTRSAIVVHRRGFKSSLTPLSWRELDEVGKKQQGTSTA